MKIKVKVFPGFKKKKVNIISEDEFEIYFRQKAENNLANRKVLEIISEIFSIDKKNIKIISGHKKTDKILSLKINKK